MKLKKDGVFPPFKSTETFRPWGYYGLYSDNEKCTSKMLYVKPGETLSLQYHFMRDQFYLVIDPGFIIEYSVIKVNQESVKDLDDDTRTAYFNKFLGKNMITVKAEEGDMFGFERLIIHRASYTGDRRFGRILDLAFGINDEEDIIRLEDKYNRD